MFVGKGFKKIEKRQDVLTEEFNDEVWLRQQADDRLRLRIEDVATKLRDLKRFVHEHATSEAAHPVLVDEPAAQDKQDNVLFTRPEWFSEQCPHPPKGKQYTWGEMLEGSWGGGRMKTLEWVVEKFENGNGYAFGVGSLAYLRAGFVLHLAKANGYNPGKRSF